MYREIALLTLLQPHGCCVRLLDVVCDQLPVTEGTTFILVCELFVMNLKVLYDRNVRQLSPREHTKFLLFELLVNLAGMHRAGVIHRDLKLGNVVTNDARNAVILDLGLARTPPPAAAAAAAAPATGVVCTPGFRAPEVSLVDGLQGATLTAALDVWSSACIALELLRCLHAEPHLISPVFRA